MYYNVKVPPTMEQGSYETTVKGSNYRFEALWQYNSCRSHDGFMPLKRMPKGTIYEPLYEYHVQGYYDSMFGMETITIEDSLKAAREQLKCYNENEPGTAHRIVKKAVTEL
jgi:hypothetical protein